VQDTAWKGYEEIPSWIMQATARWRWRPLSSCSTPDTAPDPHLCPGGRRVAGRAVTGFFANLFPKDPPKWSWSRPTPPPASTRARWPGTARPASWAATWRPSWRASPRRAQHHLLGHLKNHVTAFAACPDWVSAKGMRTLAAPLRPDPQVVSGESGAVGLGPRGGRRGGSGAGEVQKGAGH
jgi:diaminopropionate ammonia-lyase